MEKKGLYVSVLVLFSILLLAPAATGMQNAFADGNGSPEECKTDLNLDSGDPGQSGDEISTILTGEVVTGVCIKSGNASFTEDENGDEDGVNCTGKSCKGQHSVKFTEDGLYGNDGCYEVTGLGTIEVTVSKTRDDKTCKDLSHVDVMSEPGQCLTDDQCNDSNVCTGAEICDTQTLSCQSGTPLVCDDGNVCTADSCDAVNGCGSDSVPDGTIPDGSGFCDTGLLGVCAEGFDVCNSGGLTCEQSTQASAEICGDNLDNDCDGVIDNGCNVPPIGLCEELKIIDFEGLCSSTINSPISIDGNDVTLQVGVNLGGAVDGYAVTVGHPREAFQVGGPDTPTTVVGQPDDTPYESSGTPYVDAGSCFYSDDVDGFDNGFNYYLSFTNPLSSLSLDLYDYSDDGNLAGHTHCSGNTACDEDVATLTVYSDLGQTTSVGTATYTVDANNWTDGQAVTISVDDPTGPIVSASLTFNHRDRGTGIDNIAFCEDTGVPPTEICEVNENSPILYASEPVIDYSPGGDLSGWAARQVETNALGAPNYAGGPITFVSMGLGGSITLGFDSDVGGILTIYEVTNGNWPVEIVDVEVSPDNGNTWVPVGTASNTVSNTAIRENTIDLAAAGYFGVVTQVRITDVTPFSNGNPGPDYFDLDAVGALECNTGIPPADLCDNVVCDDGLFCNGVETCELGECQPGTSPVTDDGVACTVDICNEDTDSIVNDPDNSVCNDGLSCNGVEICDVNLGCEVPLTCEPEPVECIDCSKPTEFTVLYEGPDGLTFDIVKLDKDGITVKETKFVGGIVNNGESITIDSINFLNPKETVEANTAYKFSNGDIVEIHTSCSQPLYEGLEATSGAITLTVESGLVTHVKGADKGTFDELDEPIDAIPPTLACYADWKANK